MFIFDFAVLKVFYRLKFSIKYCLYQTKGPKKPYREHYFVCKGGKCRNFYVNLQRNSARVCVTKGTDR